MNYKPMIRDNFDRSFKYKKQRYLCYSIKKLREIDPFYEIVGLARNSDKDTEDYLELGKYTMAVFAPDQHSPLYGDLGYIPVADGQYIAVQESRIPFFLSLGTMAATTAGIVFLLIQGIPWVQERGPVAPKVPADELQLDGTPPLYNPLPPVDDNIEDLADAEVPGMSSSAAPEGGGKVAISYRPEATVDLSTGEVTMEYQNPGNSSHDAMLSLYVVSGDKEYLIANSGRIPAGKQLHTMQLSADKKLFGGDGQYEAEYRVYYYDPATGERALTEANIDDITLTVKSR